MKKFSVTIGISAFNEERNIASLLENILLQKKSRFELAKIIVVNDNSMDKTASIVRSVAKGNNAIVLIDDGKRAGKPTRLNQIFKLAGTEILIYVDADVRIMDTNLFNTILKEFSMNEKISLIGVNDKPYLQKKIMGKVINSWIEYWQKTRRPLNNYINPNNCAGRMFALKSDLYSKLQIPSEMAADDDFIFYETAKLGFEFQFCKKAIVYFLAPSNISDFLKQSTRFSKTSVYTRKYFKLSGNEFESLTKTHEYASYIKEIILSPVLFPMALFLQAVVHFYAKIAKTNYITGTYQPIASSK